jgi:hypothetical protein
MSIRGGYGFDMEANAVYGLDLKLKERHKEVMAYMDLIAYTSPFDKISLSRPKKLSKFIF